MTFHNQIDPENKIKNDKRKVDEALTNLLVVMLEAGVAEIEKDTIGFYVKVLVKGAEGSPQ